MARCGTGFETVRQYAAERLESRGETADVRQRHADHFLTLAESVQTRGAGQLRGLRQSTTTSTTCGPRWTRRRRRRCADGATARRGAVAVLARPWPTLPKPVTSRVGDPREGASAHDAYTRAAYGAGILAWSIGDYGRVRVLAKELLDSSRASGSRSDEHAGYKLLSHVALRERQFAAAERYSKRTLALAGSSTATTT